jgi:hypothetical protein
LWNHRKVLSRQRGKAVEEQMAEDRVALNRRIAEAMMQETILPAFATVRDELHRPEQRLYVTVTPLSPTSAELTIAQSPPDAGDRSDAAVGLRYVLTVAFGSQAIVVKRSVNGKPGSFLGQHHFTSLRQQAIVDDVWRVWRRAETKEDPRR